eukprot:Rmarinus@m.22523
MKPHGLDWIVFDQSNDVSSDDFSTSEVSFRVSQYDVTSNGSEYPIPSQISSEDTLSFGPTNVPSDSFLSSSVLPPMHFLRRDTHSLLQSTQPLLALPPGSESSTPLTPQGGSGAKPPSSNINLQSMGGVIPDLSWSVRASSGHFSHSRYYQDFMEISSLGHGGFGYVVRAHHFLDGVEYAVKKVPLRQSDLRKRERVMREVRCFARLNHPNVVRYHSAWLEVAASIHPRASHLPALRGAGTGGSPNKSSTGSSSTEGALDIVLYVQMELLRGRTLKKFLENPLRKVDPRMNELILLQITSALVHLHESQIIHRDLKPDNVFFVDDAYGDKLTVKVGDFGLSTVHPSGAPLPVPHALRGPASTEEESAPSSDFASDGSGSIEAAANRVSSTDRLSSSDTVSVERDSGCFCEKLSPSSSTSSVYPHTSDIGTRTYASPEQLSGQPYNEKTDMFSLGLIAMELYHDPFSTGMERAHVFGQVRKSHRVPEALGHEYRTEAQVIELLLSAEPEKRPSAVQLLEILSSRQEPVASQRIRTLEAEVDRLTALLSRLEANARGDVGR